MLSLEGPKQGSVDGMFSSAINIHRTCTSIVDVASCRLDEGVALCLRPLKVPLFLYLSECEQVGAVIQPMNSS